MPRKDYKVKILNLKNHCLPPISVVEETFNESKRLQELKIFLLKNIDSVIDKTWGKFGKDFILRHIIKANLLKIVRDNDKIVGIASATKKEYGGQEILYLEFTVISEKYQGYNLSSILNAEFVIDEFFSKIYKWWFKPLTIVTITRNLRVMGALSKFATYVYPDANEFTRNGKLSEAPDWVWSITNDILLNSWNPKRKIEREGNVLIGSYENTPWLLVDQTQKYYKDSVKEMAEKYLELQKKADKEFILFAQYSLVSMMKILKFINLKKSSR